MCGIAGIFDLRGRDEIDSGLLRRMTDSMSHRGPDGSGFHLEPGIGLGHRRLAIIDLSTGDQPIYNEDGTVGIVFNGEIYNYRALAAELSALGHVFKTHSDTETIVHAWEEWGPASLERLSGMFAFALWDSRTETLALARDRVGKKPLYYSIIDGRWLVFGSELKSLIAYPGLPREIDPLAVEDFFAYGYIPDPRTIYAGVHKLPPASSLILRRGEPVPSPAEYWTLRFDATNVADEETVTKALIERFQTAVDARRVADVPLGAFLSGGVDSSGVVALMAGLSDNPVNTFSISFGHRKYDESAYAQAIADRYRTRHHVRVLDGEDTDLVDRLADMYDEPFGDSSAMPTYRVSAVAREQVTVALSGDGGDEVFAGYRRYPWHVTEERLRGLLPKGLRTPIFGMLGKVYPGLAWAPRWLRFRNTFRELALDSVAGYFVNVSPMPGADRRTLYSDSLRRGLGDYDAVEVIARHMRESGTDDPLFQAQYVDFKTWLPGRMLTKVDRASMAASLEVRSPLLDHELVQWAAHLPSSLKLRGSTGKYLLKKALEPYVDSDILYRPKMGFSIPLERWFRDGALAGRIREAVSSEAIRDSGLFDEAVLQRLVQQHQSGLYDYSAELWNVLMFESFLRRVHYGERTEHAGAPLKLAAGA
ncbi:MAG: asparagine synthetase B [Rhodospirillaceae bacterium]|nr:asparagine synthetase B [Rhodospirillaceae bacterium]